jgi:hypothetical protein
MNERHISPTTGTALARRHPCIGEHLRCGSAAGGSWCPRGRRCPPRRVSARARRRRPWWRCRCGSADPVPWAGAFGGPIYQWLPGILPRHIRAGQRRPVRRRDGWDSSSCYRHIIPLAHARSQPSTTRTISIADAVLSDRRGSLIAGFQRSSVPSSGQVLSGPARNVPDAFPVAPACERHETRLRCRGSSEQHVTKESPPRSRRTSEVPRGRSFPMARSRCRPLHDDLLRRRRRDECHLTQWRL